MTLNVRYVHLGRFVPILADWVEFIMESNARIMRVCM